jgi:transcriptional regulator with XRE-family HTH domain
MEFGEKLQELRKNKDMTQEELAEALYVSRTAISKWESGRGYPSIDSLKEISRFFSVSIDELLSAEKMVSIAEKENRDNIRYICDMLLGITAVLLLAMGREAYGVSMLFLMIVAKGIVIYKMR